MVRALWPWIRSDARRRLRSLVILAILVSLTAGVVIAAIAGARRDGTAVKRLVAGSNSATLMALPNTPGFDWKRIRALPQVQTVGEFALTGVGVKGYGTVGAFPSASPELFTAVESGVVVKGRRADPKRVDEVMISPGAIRHLHMKVGDKVTLQTFSARQLAEFDTETDHPGGPSQPATIVGVFNTPFGAGYGDTGAVFTTHAFWNRYRENLVPPDFTVVNALIILRHGDRDIPVLQREADRIAGHAVELDRVQPGDRAHRARHRARTGRAARVRAGRRARRVRPDRAGGRTARQRVGDRHAGAPGARCHQRTAGRGALRRAGARDGRERFRCDRGRVPALRLLAHRARAALGTEPGPASGLGGGRTRRRASWSSAARRR